MSRTDRLADSDSIMDEIMDDLTRSRALDFGNGGFGMEDGMVVDSAE